MYPRTLRFTLGLVLALSARVGASPVQPLQPLGPWDLDYGETHCIAMRDYGTGDDRITFAIIPAPNGETYELLIGRKHPGPQFAEELEGSVDFGSGPIKAWLLHYASKDGKIDVYRYRISAAEMSQATKASTVTLHVKSGPDRAFALASMPDLFQGLRGCTADLQDYWNMGNDRKGRIAVPSKGDLRIVFRANDYPSEALRRFQSGTAQYLLLVDEKGSVAACHVLKPSGVPVLDAQGCAVLEERARLKPAIDNNGKPVRSALETPPVAWRVAW